MKLIYTLDDFLENPIMTAIISLVVSALTSYFCYKLQIRENRKAKNNDKRYEIYTACLEKIRELNKDKFKVFEKEYYENILSFKSSINLFGSKNVKKEYNEYLTFIKEKVVAYQEFYNKKDPRNVLTEYIIDEETGEEKEYFHASKLDIINFEKELTLYKEEKSEETEIRNKIQKLEESMSKDLRP